MNGHAVQLVGGKTDKMKVDAGDPVPIAEQFRIAGEIAVVDLDAALGKGNNVDVIKRLIKVAKCRVGGGIRDVETALMWLNAGATKVVLGTAAKPEILSQLPRERVVAALDADKGEVVVKGWTTKTGRSVFDCIDEIKQYVGGFLVTFVEREGRMGGIDQDYLDAIKKLKAACGDVELTIAGGVTTVEEIAMLDKLGVHAQVGMALYTHSMDLGEAIAGTR
jgi:phosphoribosylformimino-5-aminoimidazole carboxamide ribonucleotide (ProFAR) isomerase